MSEANKELTRRWFEEVWNKQNEEAIDLMFAPNGKAYGFPEPTSVLVGPESFKKIHRFFCGAFPDIRFTVQDIVSEDDMVAVRWSATMTHLGNELGFAPTMKRETLEGSSFLSIANGRIVDGRNYMELSALVQRLKTESETENSEAQSSVA
jgi:predicted ester cyclase